MIRKFIDRLLGKTPPPTPVLPEGTSLGQRVEIPVEVHGIDPKLLAEPAVRCVKTLKEEGYEAYIVGGAVRDLLVGRRPKDFDVATNATPEQVKGLFRRAYIVGRRFRLVHVIHGRGREHEQIEVSTFRAFVEAAETSAVEGNEKTSKEELAGKSHAVDSSGRVLRDNVWGPQIEDAARRDFTVNAMYYDPETQIVVDYHHGIDDSRGSLLRMIGDPEARYREDPVRIIRALRFAAKLGYQIEPRTEAPIRTMKGLLANVPSSRMFDEMIKLLQTGHSLASLEVLKRYGLDRGVFPVLDAHFEGIAKDPEREEFVNRALRDTDRRVNEGKPVAPSFLMACVFWHEVSTRWEVLRTEGEPVAVALQKAVDATFEARIGDISGRGKLAADMREIWLMQPRFEKRTGNVPEAMFNQPRFRAAFDFLRLRAEAGEGDPELVAWWQEFSNCDEDQRKEMVETLRVETVQRHVEKSATRVAKQQEREAKQGVREAKASSRSTRSSRSNSSAVAGLASKSELLAQLSTQTRAAMV
ncbi:MAG TPA: polynucleotide adenylyltransferase PcnB, partial [Burkholderiaceae bacterium]|nr:polynucleotide adenylyltransferase PcnB [Burkholderiaceae bacterium]